MIASVLARVAMAATAALSNSSACEVPARFAAGFGCVANLPSPHPSGGFIKAHMRIACQRPVAAARVEVQLWRLRSWGWEQIGVPGEYDKPRRVRTVDAVAKASAASDECYSYRSTGRGYVINWRGEKLDSPGEGVNYDQRFLKGLAPGCGTKW